METARVLYFVADKISFDIQSNQSDSHFSFSVWIFMSHERLDLARCFEIRYVFEHPKDSLTVTGWAKTRKVHGRNKCVFKEEIDPELITVKHAERHLMMSLFHFLDLDFSLEQRSKRK